ncbi:cache domain-containing protein [Ramlibacter sp. USB13]|uniref:Cache domain-containing protein n=1 Tax=Ramlibacter cellulosilyticus TaxID=2764187 RepID=A0A923MPE2_9BURK|nr:methyl-accepting chemotaxis protein [Ramlibacter cellulosilyticus]MBC5782129.1 cache domain-containing protein [Ramlibacter cellulosilyticus]
MTTHALPTALSPDAAARLPLAERGRTYLSVRIAAVLGAIGVLVAALTVLAAWQLQGPAAIAALLLGGLALVGLALTAAWLLRGLVGPLGPLTAATARLGTGDLTVVVDPRSAGELRPLAGALLQVREHLLRVVSQVRTGTTNVALNAAVIHRDNEALSQRTDTQADSLQETAASMEQLTAVVRQNAGTAQEAHALARTATDRATGGGEVMREVVQTMDSIRASSRSIQDIIGVIDGIAFQTNILALNAAVEAARAGEQGRGFAVVAAEVRMLAQRCAEAAREIKALISASVHKVDTGGARVDEASAAMAEIVESVQRVAHMIGQMDAASQEQSSGIDTINLAISRIDSTTQENAAFVKAAARTAAALQERAVTLQQSVAGFDLGQREHGSAEDAVDLVRRGCELLRARGRDALLADVNRLDAGSLIDRDLYLIVLDENGIFIAHGNNPGRLGKGPEVRDIDGKAFGTEFVRVALERGQGWVDYKWVHPVTGEVSVKSGFVRHEGGLVLACAITK